ncbi:MAG: HD domain-containing protein [Paracoccaceae bacterium]
MTPAAARYKAHVAQLWGSGPADGAHDLGHLARVWANARSIALDEPDVDWPVLEAAVWFHDLVNLPKNSPDRARASTLSADAAVAFLQFDGFPPEKLPAVAHAIAAHSFSAGIAPETPEARILQDADRLEALGAIGLARMFLISGRMGGGIIDMDDPMALHRPLDDKAFALDHLEVKLLGLPVTMQTRTGRLMAEERAEWMMSFRSRLLLEVG